MAVKPLCVSADVCIFANGWLSTGKPNDDRPTCPPPITAERARQNVPSASSYMSLKHSRSHRSSGSTEQETVSSSTQSVNKASGQRLHEDETRKQVPQRKKVSETVFCETCVQIVEAVETPDDYNFHN